MSAGSWVLLALVVVVFALTVSWCVSRARRLDRLHVRLDAARAGLTAALDRRVAAASLAGCAAPAVPPVGGVTDLAARAAAESALTRRLAAADRGRLDPGLLRELVDAEQLVILARRVHNDAVRDTHALRSRRLVRWLRLAGGAPEPVYFDIAEPEPDRAPAPTSLPPPAPTRGGRA